MTNSQFLSKSQYVRGMQCYKSLYLYKYHKELQDEISASQQAIFASGTDVGILAQELFPDGVEVPYEGLSISEQVRITKDEIAKGTKTIYEASFEFDGLFVKVDILHHGTNGWELYEVKSSTAVKAVNYHDVSFQFYVVTGAGIHLSKTSLVHINNQYVRNGNIEVDQLFTINDMTSDVLGMQESIPNVITKIRSMLDSPSPNIEIGPHCSDPYDCDFHGHCWQHIPVDSVFDLRGRGIDKFSMYHRGLISLNDIPLNELNNNQRFQVEMHLSKGEQIDKNGIRDFLEGLWYPLCHFDFETFMSPVPLHNGMRPYQAIPFQYSLHIQREEGGPIEHYEFLAKPNIDPRPDLIQAMLSQIPIDSCVLAYNMSFEKTRIKEMSEDFPEYAEGLNHIYNRIMDLIVPFRKRYAYRWQQHGSNSIKHVLPAFIPELSYNDLEISHGGMAMDAYHLMCAEKVPKKLETLRNNLLKYCERDTLAMVKLHQFLVKTVTSNT